MIVKKDTAFALIGILAIAALCFGLAQMRLPLQPTKSAAFETTRTGPTVTGTVIMRVNGEPVTQTEFEAAFAQLPDEMKQQFASAPGKQAFAEQYVRLKLLEQEGRRLGLDRDPRVEAVLTANRMNIVAQAAADKLVKSPTAQAVQEFYKQNATKFQQIDLSHIVIAYAGSTIPPRKGGQAPSEMDATNVALKIWQEIHNGADFAAMARKYSDDVNTIEQGGHLGNFSPGMMPPEIDARVWRLAQGQISDPIPTKFGVHIFKVNAKKNADLPQVSGNIARHVKQQNTLDRIEILRKSAKVEFDPKFFPEAKSWPTQYSNPIPSKKAS